MVRAARAESDERVAEEAADLLYHLACCWSPAGWTLKPAMEALNARRD